MPELLNSGNVIARAVAGGVELVAGEGEYGSNTNGHWLRFENGVQFCWITNLQLDYSTAKSLVGAWTFPVPFSTTPVGIPFGFPTSGGAYDSLNLNSLGRPFTALGPTQTSMSVYAWSNDSPYSSGQAVRVNVAALGRWK